MHEVAGFTLAQSDLMRRAMGKKKEEVMAQQRESFVSGAAARGITPKVAREIFDMIVKFANYGFNKSHSVAYSLLAYQTAWLKANYTPEFMAALMTSEMTKTDKVSALIDECGKLGIAVLPPDVNESGVTFTVTDHGIRFGLAAIKNVGVGAVEAIVAARGKGGAFTSIFDFCERVEGRLANKKTLESLVLAGAMDTVHANRAQLFQALEAALSFGQQRQLHRDQGQSSLFDNAQDSEASALALPALPQLDDWKPADRLANEKSVLGFYVSGHPLEPWRSDVEAIATVSLGAFDDTLDGSTVRAVGVISALRTKIDKKGKTMAFMTVEDFTGKAECLVFGSAYEKFVANIRLDAPVAVIGKVRSSGDAFSLMADEIYSLEQAIARFTKSVVISLSTRTVTPQQLKDGIRLLDEFRMSGNCPCFIAVTDSHGTAWKLYAKQHRIQASGEVLRRLRSIFGKNSVRIALE